MSHGWCEGHHSDDSHDWSFALLVHRMLRTVIVVLSLSQRHHASDGHPASQTQYPHFPGPDEYEDNFSFDVRVHLIKITRGIQRLYCARTLSSTFQWYWLPNSSGYMHDKVGYKLTALGAKSYTNIQVFESKTTV